MQVSGNYTAIGPVAEIQPGQRMRRAPPRHSGRSGDTVSISDEAMAAYRQSLGQDVAALDEATLERGAKFRRALEEAWNGAGETARAGRLLSAIASLKM